MSKIPFIRGFQEHVFRHYFSLDCSITSSLEVPSNHVLLCFHNICVCILELISFSISLIYTNDSAISRKSWRLVLLRNTVYFCPFQTMCEIQVQYDIAFFHLHVHILKKIAVLLSDAIKINISFKRMCNIEKYNFNSKTYIFTTGFCNKTCICNTWNNLKIILMHYESPVKK